MIVLDTVWEDCLGQQFVVVRRDQCIIHIISIEEYEKGNHEVNRKYFMHDFVKFFKYHSNLDIL